RGALDDDGLACGLARVDRNVDDGQLAELDDDVATAELGVVVEHRQRVRAGRQVIDEVAARLVGDDDLLALEDGRGRDDGRGDQRLARLLVLDHAAQRARGARLGGRVGLERDRGCASEEARRHDDGNKILPHGGSPVHGATALKEKMNSPPVYAPPRASVMVAVSSTVTVYVVPS